MSETKPTDAELVGVRFDVVDRLRNEFWFPRDFRVIAQTQGMIQVRNQIETYWIHRARLDACLAEGSIYRSLKS